MCIRDRATGGRRGAPTWLLAVIGLAAVAIIAVGVILLLRGRNGPTENEPPVTITVETVAVVKSGVVGVTAEPSATASPTVAPTRTPTPTPAATERPTATATPANWRIAVLPGGVESCLLYTSRCV